MEGEGNDVAVSAMRVPGRMSYAPCPFERPPFPNGYMTVDYDDATGTSDRPWPGQIDYELDHERSELDVDDDGHPAGTAVYVLVERPSRAPHA